MKAYGDRLAANSIVSDENNGKIFWETPVSIDKYGIYANILHGKFVNYYRSATELVKILRDYPTTILGVVRDCKANNPDTIRIALGNDLDAVFSVINCELNMSVLYSYAELWNETPIDMCMWGMLQDLICHLNYTIIPGRLTIYIHQPFIHYQNYKDVLAYVQTVKDNIKEIDAMKVVAKNKIDKDDKNINNMRDYIENGGNIFEDEATKLIRNIKPTAFSVEGYRYIEGTAIMNEF
jgi:hypothetical protein